MGNGGSTRVTAGQEGVAAYDMTGDKVYGSEKAKKGNLCKDMRHEKGIGSVL